MPPLADLSFAGLDDSVYRPTANKTSASVSQVEANITPPSDASVEMPRVESVAQWSYHLRYAVVLVNGTGVTAVKPQIGENPQQALKNKGIFDSGCSRHMTGNKDFLTDYQDIDGGFVAFGGSARGELKFNLFYVSQMCDKKNSVLFTETECLVLSPNFKLLDESQVLLRVPRQSNMYNFDLKNVCLWRI
ncbi:hypothetical protein Tco_0517712 [Tanacetum coccineum]